ncbi:unnamed protein product, partial [marine sediment metagenome]
ELRVENSQGSVARTTSTAEIGTKQWIRLRPDDATYSFDAGLNGTPVWADDGIETSITIGDSVAATDQPSESLIKSILIEGITWGDVDSIHLDVRVGTVEPASADGFKVGMIIGDSNVPTTYSGLTTLSKIGSTSTTWTMDTKPGNDAWTMTGTGTNYNAILTVVNMARTTATFKSTYAARYAVNYGASAGAHRDGFFTEDMATTDPVHLGMLVNRSTGGSGPEEATFQFRYKIMKKRA